LVKISIAASSDDSCATSHGNSLQLLVFMANKIIETEFQYDKTPFFKGVTHGKNQAGNYKAHKKSAVFCAFN